MKKINYFLTGTLLLLSTIALAQVQKAQNVQVGNTSTTTMNSSAALQIDDTARGFLGARMTTAQRTAIAAPATGLQVYDTDTNSLWLYNGTAWIDGASSATAWSKTGNSGTNRSTNFIGTTDNNSLYFRTKNTQRMVIDTLGQIGIGRNVPRAKFDLYKGDFVLADTLDTSRNSRYQIQANSSTTGAKFMASYGYRNLLGIGMSIDDKPVGHNTDEILYLNSGTTQGNTNNYGAFRSIDNQFSLSGSGTVGDFVGYHSELFNKASALNTFTGMRLWLKTEGTGTTTNLYGLDIRDWSSTGSTSNKYGIYLGGMSAGTVSTYSIYSPGDYAAYFQGNMGLGTSSPTEKLQVQGNIRFSGALMPNNTAGTAGQVLTSAGAGSAPTWTTPTAAANIYTADGTLSGNRTITQGTNTLAFTSNATNGFSVDGTTFSIDALNNRIGLGTATPSYTLDVAGNIRATSNIITSGKIGIGTTNPVYEIDISTVNGVVNATYHRGQYITLLGGTTSIGFKDGSYTGCSISNTANALTFAQNDNSGTMLFNLNGPVGTKYFSFSGGNLGIGTSASPTEKLEVSGNIKFSGAIMPNNTPGTAGQILTSSGAGAPPVWTTPASSTNTLYAADGTLTGNRVVTQGTNSLAFTSTATTGTSQFTIDGTTLNIDTVNNRIGLGTAAPSYTLDINGNLRTTSNIITSGKIGIGTNTPYYEVDANTGTINATYHRGQYLTLIGGTTSISFKDSTYTGCSISNTGNVLTFAQNDNNGTMLFNLNGPGTKYFSFSGGNLGIGTTTPTVKLEIAGAIKVGNETITTPTAGMIRFNATTNTFEGYNGTTWVTF